MQEGGLTVQRIWQGVDFAEFLDTYCQEWPHVDAKEAADRLFETLRFMYVNLFVNFFELEPGVSPSAVVDQMWHYLILHVGLYLKICDKMMPRDFTIDGLRIIPHKPRDGLLTLPGNEERYKKRYEQCLKLYRKNFGEPDVRFWPREAPRPEGKIKLYVHTNTGKIKTVYAQLDWTVNTLKQAINSLEYMFDPMHARMKGGGRLLQDELTLGEQGITDEMTMYYIVRLRGC